MLNLGKAEILDQAKPNNLSLFRLLYLNLKVVYSTGATRLVIVLSPILVTLALAVMMPLQLYVGAGQIFVTSLSAGTLGGMTYFSMRRSTLYSNINVTRNKNYVMYLSILLTMLIVTFCSEFLFGVSSIVFYYIIPSSFIENVFNVANVDYSITGSEINGGAMVYVGFMSVTLMFAGSFAFRGVFDKEKNYFIILFVYVIFLFPFGGLVPYPITNGDLGSFNPIQGISLFVPQTSLEYMSFFSVKHDINPGQGSTIDGKGNFVYIYPIVSLTLLSIGSALTVEFIE